MTRVMTAAIPKYEMKIKKRERKMESGMVRDGFFASSPVGV